MKTFDTKHVQSSSITKSIVSGAGLARNAAKLPKIRAGTKPPVKKKPPVEKPPVKKPPVDKPPIKKPPVTKPPVKKPPVIRLPDVKPVKPVQSSVRQRPTKPVIKGPVKPSASLVLPPKPLIPPRLAEVLSVVDTITGVVSLLYPVGTYLLASGDKQLPDGRIADAGGEYVTDADGNVQYLDGTIIYGDGTVKFPDGTYQYTDGSVMYPDGMVGYPDGTWRFPDGTVTDSEGNILATDYPEQ